MAETTTEATQVLTTVCQHGRPMAARVYVPDDPDAHEWWADELRSLPDGWHVTLWPRDADFTWCQTCEAEWL